MISCPNFALANETKAFSIRSLKDFHKLFVEKYKKQTLQLRQQISLGNIRCYLYRLILYDKEGCLEQTDIKTIYYITMKSLILAQDERQLQA